jgi:hypothetical protein
VYFKWFEDEQGNLMDKAIKDKNKIEARKGVVKYL